MFLIRCAEKYPLAITNHPLGPSDYIVYHRLSICLSTYLSTCLSIYLCICVSVYPSIYLCVCLSVRLLVCFPVVHRLLVFGRSASSEVKFLCFIALSTSFFGLYLGSSSSSSSRWAGRYSLRLSAILHVYHSPYLLFNKSTFCLNSVLVGFVWCAEQT